MRIKPYYSDGRIEIYHGNCLEVLPELCVTVDMVLADPPYGTTACAWDSVIPLEPMWKQLKRLIKVNGAIVMTASQPFTTTLISSNMELFKYCWVWEKERLTNITQVKNRAGKTVEDVCVFYTKQVTYNPQMEKYTGPRRTNKVKHGKLGKLTDSGTKRVKEYKDTGYRYPTQLLKFQRDTLKSNLHPTQKPVALMEYLIKTYTNEEDLVLDFTMGSGTTLVAAKNLNRRVIGIEKVEKYCEVAVERLAQDVLNFSKPQELSEVRQ